MSGVIWGSRNVYLVGEDRPMTTYRRAYRKPCEEKKVRAPTFYSSRAKVQRRRLQNKPVTPHQDPWGRRKPPPELAVPPASSKSRSSRNLTPTSMGGILPKLPASRQQTSEKRVSYARAHARSMVLENQSWEKVTQCGVDFFFNTVTGVAQMETPPKHSNDMSSRALPPLDRAGPPAKSLPPLDSAPRQRSIRTPKGERGSGQFAFLDNWQYEAKPRRW